MGIMCYRIAMILTALRHYELGINEDNMVCLGEDLESAMLITIRISYFARQVYAHLEEYGKRRASNKADDGKCSDDERLLCYNYYKQGDSLRAIADKVFLSRGAFMKVKRILQDYGIYKAA